jgi:sulfur carrier protein ThiS
MGSPVPEKPLIFFPGAVEGKEDSIGITLRSFVLPPGSGDDFPLGHPVSLRVPQGTSVKKLLEKIFAERRNQVGLVAINGRVAEGKTLLADGDRVDVFELLGGG